MSIPLTRDDQPRYVPIGAQISEVRRELEMRAQVYPRRVREGKLRQVEADLFTSRMEAVLRTLEYMRDHRDTIIRAVKDAQEMAHNIETGGADV
jgi:hypothetical protein